MIRVVTGHVEWRAFLAIRRSAAGTERQIQFTWIDSLARFGVMICHIWKLAAILRSFYTPF